MYIVIEIQAYNDGTVGILTDHYTDKAQADNKYYTILAAAAISEVPTHSATMITVDGRFVKSECYRHE